MSESGIRLRDFEVSDRGAIFDLVAGVLAEYGLETDSATTDRDLSDIYGHYAARGGCFKVIEDGGRIVGSYGIVPLGEGVCELRKMYLLAEYRGKGLGRLMMEDALAEARKRGFGFMVLETNTVLGRAMEMYRKYGFEECKTDHLSERCDCAMRLTL